MPMSYVGQGFSLQDGCAIRMWGRALALQDGCAIRMWGRL
jgi:hypothetical protein